jgi:hypothetical protein
MGVSVIDLLCCTSTWDISLWLLLWGKKVGGGVLIHC